MQITNTTDELGMYRDWEGYRGVITRLYSDENRPLKEVVHIMAREYDFQATEKMYKDRLKRWGIRKYMKSAPAGEGELPTKRTLTPRHRELDPHRIRQFLHQSSFRLRKSAPGKKATILSTSHPPSPTTLNTRGDLAGMEVALQAATTYTNTCFETGAWDFSLNISGLIPNQWRFASFDLLHSIFDEYRSLLYRQDPSLVILSLLAIVDLLAVGDELARAFVRYAAPLARIELGERHPLAVLWTKLESVQEPRHLQEAVRTMTSAELDTVDRNSVPGSLYPTRSRVMVTLALYCNGLMDAVSTEAKLQAIYTVMWWYRAQGGADSRGGWIDWRHHPLSQVAIDDIWDESGGDPQRFDEMRKQLPFARRLRHSKRLLSFECWADVEEFSRQKRIQARVSLMEGDYTAMLQDLAYDEAIR
ncbi:Clr5 domain-containing protein [Apiospora kogelbergensis]|uniref:Clr5 domain-containing protein n=1 Tax=Apiospora kogelbergensis TaxID=1337665 RepID=UPI00312FC0B4